MAVDLSGDSMLGRTLGEQRAAVEDARFDITAMVDLVFMMNIFFLVTWVGAALAEVDLPAAQHCVASDVGTSVVVTVLASGGGEPLVYLGDGQSGPPLTNAAEIEQRMVGAAQAGVAEGKDTLLIKAEKAVHLRDLARIARAGLGAGELKLRLAVIEKE